MQTPLKLLATLALACIIVLASAGCNQSGSGKSAQSGGSGGAGGTSAPDVDPEAIAAGKVIYGSQGCAMCHADDLKGKPTLAPPLSGLKANWDAKKLADYLHDPQGYAAADTRLKERHDTFSMRMPAYTQIPPEDEAKLISFLLSQ